jgi:hypothetical protein
MTSGDAVKDWYIKTNPISCDDGHGAPKGDGTFDIGLWGQAWQRDPNKRADRCMHVKDLGPK